MNFPDFIQALPTPDSPVRMEARIIPNRYCTPMFYEIDTDVEVPRHAHGAQWGVVLDGEMEMVIDGVSRTYQRGDTYYVPPGIDHTTRIKAGYRGIDIFADPDRYLPKEDA